MDDGRRQFVSARPLSLILERPAERPGASRAHWFWAATRTLGGEDRSETCARRERGLVDPADPRWSPENRPYVVTSKAAGGRIWVDVFDLATCRDQSDIQQFFPGIKVVQTPILGIWSLGHLTEVLQGFYARERALDVVRKGSVQG